MVDQVVAEGDDVDRMVGLALGGTPAVCRDLVVRHSMRGTRWFRAPLRTTFKPPLPLCAPTI